MKQTERLSFSKKNANNKQWYKEKTDSFDYVGVVGNEYKKMKVNYDLFNNKLDVRDFEYVCKPYGSEVGELPAKMVNRDIVSGKIKALLGMEMKRPFAYTIIATNPEATTRKEQEEFGAIKKYVTDKILEPLRLELLAQQEQMVQGRDLTEEEMAQLQEQLQAEMEQRTPEEVKAYMRREYQDPAEVLSHQLLKYLTEKCELKTKFNKLAKHFFLSSKGIMYVGILNGEPTVWNVNSLNFNYAKQSDNDIIEDCEWATCEYRMAPSQIIRYFADTLNQKDLDNIFEHCKVTTVQTQEDLFELDSTEEIDMGSLPVLHCVWKSLRKIGFLSYTDLETGEEHEMLVDEFYKINPDVGDTEIKWEWIPEVYETWKIKTPDPIYVNMRPVPNQFKDVDNLYYSKLPYYGIVCDNMNSTETSLMDRLKPYQYYYNIVMYRLELLLASDKGKKILMNASNIPDNMDVSQWTYFMESTPFLWYDAKQEGGDRIDAGSVAKEMDLSLISDIQKYIQLGEYIRQQAGRSVGITENVEGQQSQYESVRNNTQSLVQSGYILEPYFELLDRCKKNIIQGLVETAKVAYGTKQPRKLTYILDDMSREIINVDPVILDNSTLGIFVADNRKTYEIMNVIQQLSHAALQNQQANLSDVIKILKQESIVEMEETLILSEERSKNERMDMQKQQQEFSNQQLEQQQALERERFDLQKQLILLKEEERRKTEIAKISMLGASYNAGVDTDEDGVNDYLQMMNPDGTVNGIEGKTEENVLNGMNNEELGLQEDDIDIDYDDDVTNDLATMQKNNPNRNPAAGKVLRDQMKHVVKG